MRFAVIWLAIIGFAPLACACSLAYRTVSVGPNFRVTVADASGRPGNGVRLKIDKDGAGTYVQTDRHGVAIFRGIAAGNYWLGPHLDYGGGDTVALEVKSNELREITFPLRWPAQAPVAVRTLQGTIYAPSPKSILTLELLDPNTGNGLKSWQTALDGTFSSENVAPGFYFLRATWMTTIGAAVLMPVVVDRNAPADRMEVSLMWTSCGLLYSDLNQCAGPDLQIPQLAGVISDVAGAAIEKAEISVYDTAEKLVEQLRSDSAGKFASTRSLSGTHRLSVSIAGFSLLRRTVHFEPGESTKSSVLALQLGVAGACGSAEVR